ncbi:MAG: hypothetical protein EBR82_18990 [Caulobacteraceae bacterium]|nr:hypothetical protein [Caulobacteraceae bacterium]
MITPDKFNPRDLAAFTKLMQKGVEAPEEGSSRAFWQGGEDFREQSMAKLMAMSSEDLQQALEKALSGSPLSETKVRRLNKNEPSS